MSPGRNGADARPFIRASITFAVIVASQFCIQCAPAASQTAAPSEDPLRDKLKQLEQKLKDQANQPPPKDTESSLLDPTCQRDIECFGRAGSLIAEAYCKPEIEKLAVADVKWTDGWFGQIFSEWKWKDQRLGIVTYSGDQARFQNRMGVFIRIHYECDFATLVGGVIAVRASEP